MRHLSRYSARAKGLFTPEGRKGRKVVAIDVRPTPTTKNADVFLQVVPGNTFEIATILRALVLGVGLEGADEEMSVAGVPLDSWRKVADMIKGCAYGVLFFGLGVTQCRGRDVNVEQVARLVQDVNRHTRFYAMAMRGHGNVNGSNHVLAWQTGYPLAVNFSRGYARYNPGEFSVVDMLARREVDAALIVATDPGARPAPGRRPVFAKHPHHPSRSAPQPHNPLGQRRHSRGPGGRCRGRDLLPHGQRPVAGEETGRVRVSFG